ncbi:PucR family transcriptional regulator [Streptomyces gamaensis]|uniref:PucR family transcriptional regulator n=1 Tax=Streptomyces gamaensis TaxID=1763542 RepID=A0ABW0Z5W8_9ACTN
MSLPVHAAGVRGGAVGGAGNRRGTADRGARLVRLPDRQPPAGAGSVVPALAGALIRRAPQLVEELMELAQERGVGYHDRLPETEIRRSLREHLLGFLRFVAAGPTPEGDPLAVATGWGHCRAREGVAVESVLRMHRLATQLLWEKLFDEAGADSPEVLRRLVDESGPVWEMLDTYSSALVEGYRSAETDARRQDAARRDALVDALLEGRGTEPAVAAEAGIALGLPPRGRFVVITVDTGGEAAPGPAPALPVHTVQAVWRTRGDRTVGLVELGRTPVRQLVERLSGVRGHRMGVSGEVGGLAELAAAHHFAETALQTLPPGTAGVAAFDDRLLEAFVVTSPHVARRLAQHALGGLLECAQDERSLLLATLDSWFHCGCSAARAAEILHCHRNTVLNRLRRVESLTGRSLDDDRHQLACRMALVAVRTLPPASPPPPAARTA